MVRWVELREIGSVAYVELRPVVPDERDQDAGIQDAGIVVARVVPSEVVSPGQCVRVEIDVDRTFWFDTRTGNNLAVPR